MIVNRAMGFVRGYLSLSAGIVNQEENAVTVQLQRVTESTEQMNDCGVLCVLCGPVAERKIQASALTALTFARGSGQPVNQFAHFIRSSGIAGLNRAGAACVADGDFVLKLIGLIACGCGFGRLIEQARLFNQSVQRAGFARGQLRRINFGLQADVGKTAGAFKVNVHDLTPCACRKLSALAGRDADGGPGFAHGLLFGRAVKLPGNSKGCVGAILKL